MTTAPPAPFITTPLRDVATWVGAFHQRGLPVLEATAAAIDELQTIEDKVDARMLADTLSADPLMTLKLLRHVSQIRSSRMLTDPETATAAIVLMGIPPFFHAFVGQPTVEAHLATHAQALAGLQAVVARAHRAARFALGFAVHRMDHDAAVIHEAALLHDFAEMLLWIHAPTLALHIAKSQHDEPTTRSAEIQLAVLNTTLSDLQQSLMRTWRLPELLVKISDDHASNSPQVQNVQLAIRVARHSTLGWDNAALPDDIEALSKLLNMSPGHVKQLLVDLDS